MVYFQPKGMGVALVTPFQADKSVDYEALKRLVEYVIDEGADFIVVQGTTGETATMTHDEIERVSDAVRHYAAGRVPLVIGIGGNCTANVCHEIKSRDLDGYAAVLSVVPFYNKPQQEGIYRHYTEIANASPLPVILYNVPGRTGVNMTAETTLRLAEVDNIIAVKEASGNFTQIEQIIKHAPQGFNVISGDDGITFPLISLGASGVISVLGNACPRKFSEMVHMALSGNMDGARRLHHEFAEVFRLLFVDGNPAGIKCALAHLGLAQEILRLPLVSVTDHTRQLLRQALVSIGYNSRI